MSAVDLHGTGAEALRPATVAPRMFNGNGAATPAEASPEKRPLTSNERACGWVLGVALLGLGALGFMVSFREVERAVEPSFGSLAWSAPIGIDLGIAVFTGLDLFLTHLGMRMRLLRLLPWTLVGVTVALNVAQPWARGDMIGAAGHGVLPVLWVAAVEVTAHVMRHRAGLGQSAEQRRATGSMDQVRTARWLLAPLSTLRIHRLMILWEERSYQAALERWMARSRARGHMAKRYGRIKWRWRAPIDQRLDYRYAQLTLQTATATSDDTPPASSERGSRNPGDVPARRRQGAAPTKPPTKPPADERDLSDLLPRAREIKARLAAEGVRLTRDTLAKAWREDGSKLSTADAGPLVAALKADTDGNG